MKMDIHHPIESFGIRSVSLSGIRVEKLEDRVNPAVPFPHRHDFWQVILITGGAGIHQIDFKTWKVKPNQVFIIKPGQVHRWQMKKNIRGIIVEFTRTAQLLSSSDELIMHDQEFSELRLISEVMHQEFSRKLNDYDTALRALLTAFIIHLERFAGTSEEKTSTIIDGFRNLVEKNFKTEHRVEFYAKKLNVTPKALTMQVTRAIGKSPRAMIQERFMMEARRHLAFTSMSIAEIGFELGFEDANYFTRFFRLHEKVTPAAFRKKYAI